MLSLFGRPSSVFAFWVLLFPLCITFIFYIFAAFLFCLMSTSSVAPKKRSLDYFLHLEGAAEESDDTQYIFAASAEFRAELRDFDPISSDLEPGASTFFNKTCKIVKTGPAKSDLSSMVGRHFVASGSIPKPDEVRNLHFLAASTLAIAKVLTADARGILVEVLGWLSEDPSVPVSADEAGLLYRGKRIFLDAQNCAYLALRQELAAGIVNGLCTLGPRVDISRYKRQGIAGVGGVGELGERGRGVGEGRGGMVTLGGGGIKDLRLDVDGREWICTAKDWSTRLARLRFPLRLMETDLSKRLFQALALDLDELFLTAETLSFSPSAGYLALFAQTPRVRGLEAVTNQDRFLRVFLGEFRGRDCDHISLVHFTANPAAAWARFNRRSCDLDVRCFLAQLVKMFEVVLSAYIHRDFLNITLPLRDALEDVTGVFRHTGDEVVYFRVHECLAQWMLDIRTEESCSAHFPDHPGLVGDDARTLLSKFIERLLADSGTSSFPHDLEYTASGTYAAMRTPQGPVGPALLAAPAAPVAPAAPAVPASPPLATSDIVCGYHLCRLLGVKNYKDELVTCRRPAGCQLGPHVTSLTGFTKHQALKALEDSALMGGLRSKAAEAIETFSSWRV